MQIKTTNTLSYTFKFYYQKKKERERKRERLKITSVGEDVEKLKPCTLLERIQNGEISIESGMVITQKIIELPYDPPIYFWVYT